MSTFHFQVIQATPTQFSSSSKPRQLPRRSSPLEALETCSSIAQFKQHHAHFIKLGLSADNDAMGRLIKFCALSNKNTEDFDYALRMFDALPQPDAFIYNTLMRGCLQLQPLQQPAQNCICLYLQMLQHFVLPNKFTFPSLIRACSVDNAVEQGTQVHAHVFKFGFSADGFCSNNLIHMYVNFGDLENAKKVFDKMPKRDVVSWTTLISGYAQLGLVDEAFEILN